MVRRRGRRTIMLQCMTGITRTILITGASRGIGRATALALAGPGVRLVLAARSLEVLEEVADQVHEAGATAEALPCDVTVEADVVRLVGAVGPLDLLVHSVGGALVAPLEELTLAEWEGMLRAHLTSAFLVCKYAAPRIRAGGLIVLVASVAARQPFPHWSAYCAVKAGLLGFAGALREELRPRGVRVSSVLPAATDTSLWEGIPGSWNRANMLQPADVARAIAGLAAQPPTVTVEELVIGHVAGRL